MNRKVIILKDKWITSAGDVPEPRALEMIEITPDRYVDGPFPLNLDAQKRLLELIYTRKSGIITREELINVLFNPEGVPSGQIIRCRL